MIGPPRILKYICVFFKFEDIAEVNILLDIVLFILKIPIQPALIAKILYFYLLFIRS